MKDVVQCPLFPGTPVLTGEATIPDTAVHPVVGVAEGVAVTTVGGMNLALRSLPLMILTRPMATMEANATTQHHLRSVLMEGPHLLLPVVTWLLHPIAVLIMMMTGMKVR